jgi:hypothetical protein
VPGIAKSSEGVAPSKQERIPVTEVSQSTGVLIVQGTSGEVLVADDPDHPGVAALGTNLGGASYTLPY